MTDVSRDPEVARLIAAQEAEKATEVAALEAILVAEHERESDRSDEQA